MAPDGRSRSSIAVSLAYLMPFAVVVGILAAVVLVVSAVGLVLLLRCLLSRVGRFGRTVLLLLLVLRCTRSFSLFCASDLLLTRLSVDC